MKQTPKEITRWKTLSSRPKGRPKKQWEDVLRALQTEEIEIWKTFARSKEQWKETAEPAETHLGL